MPESSLIEMTFGKGVDVDVRATVGVFDGIGEKVGSKIGEVVQAEIRINII